MSEPTMPSGFGSFCWNQLNTPDPAASRAFYTGLFGWAFVEERLGGRPVTLISAGERVVGDLERMPEGLKAPSHWLSYVWVADLDAAAAKAVAMGGKLCLPPTEIPEVGRIAVMQDPAGASLGLYASGHPSAGPQPILPGTFCWYECVNRDVPKELAFYGELFGWTSALHPVPGGHPYHLLSRGADQVAGMMPMQGPEWEGIPDHWMAYVAVADIEATVARVLPLGGKVLVPVMDITIGRFAVLMDPLGAALSVFQGA